MIRRPAPFVASALAGVALVAGCGIVPDRDESGAIVGAGDLSVFDVRVGDCFDRPDDDETPTILDGIPCFDEHTNRVVGIHRADDAGSDYPGREALAEEAEAACADDVAASLDIGLDWYPLLPTAESWDDRDDEELVCVVFDPDGDPLPSPGDAEPDEDAGRGADGGS